MRLAQYDDEKAPPCTLYPDLHFIKKGRKDQKRLAKEVCFSCQVRMSCLDGALERNEKYGMFGGMTTRERGYERKRRGIAERSLLLSQPA
jgi:hypothetical protein